MSENKKNRKQSSGNRADRFAWDAGDVIVTKNGSSDSESKNATSKRDEIKSRANKAFKK